MDRKQTNLRRCRWLQLAAAAALVAVNGGCSLFVMAGKMMKGDPAIPSDFEQYTHKSLTEEGQTVAVLCSTPEGIKKDFPSLSIDLLSEVSHRLRAEKIEVVPPHEVARWIDDNGGQVGELGELARAVKADYVIHIHLDQFSYKEDNSPNLFRGRCSGVVNVWEVPDDEDKKPAGAARQVYSKSFNSTYPTHQPVPVDQTPATVFRHKYLTRVADELARLFYPTRPGALF